MFACVCVCNFVCVVQVMTSKQYIRDVTVIDLAWLAEFAPKFFASSSQPQSKLRLSQKQQQRLSSLPDAALDADGDAKLDDGDAASSDSSAGSRSAAVSASGLQQSKPKPHTPASSSNGASYASSSGAVKRTASDVLRADSGKRARV